jgi:hypothetical protein
MVTDAALSDAVGPEVLERARRYVARAVLDVRVAEDARRVTGLVQGGAEAPYRTTVVRTDGGRVGWAGACTCPVGDDCKHAVAVLLYLRPQVQRAPGGPLSRAGRTWEQELEELVTAAAERAPRTSVPLGLQFELVEQEPGRGRASVGAPGTRQRLVRLRPVTPGQRGAWVRSGVSWKQLQYDSVQAGWDRAQLAALRALHATHQAARGQYYSYAPVDVFLHEFGPGLWRLLAEAVADGVALITADRPPRPVLLAPTDADIAVDLRRDEDRTELSAVLRIDGRPVDPERLSFLGVPPHGVTVDGPRLGRPGRPSPSPPPTSTGSCATGTRAWPRPCPWSPLTARSSCPTSSRPGWPSRCATPATAPSACPGRCGTAPTGRTHRAPRPPPATAATPPPNSSWSRRCPARSAACPSCGRRSASWPRRSSWPA